MPLLHYGYKLARPLVFQFNPESIHALCFGGSKILQKVPGFHAALKALARNPAKGLAREVAGLQFASPLGLAAGLDKGAELLPLWKDLGFGFVEIGTVTPLPQPGNPKPRLFRLPAEGLILNRMGFNSEGAEVVAARLKKRPKGLIIGGNIGKNKTTPEAAALSDYCAAYERIAPEVDYIAINLSSPNTPGLRNLQTPQLLKPLLDGILTKRKEMRLEAQPLFIKLAPDLPSEELDGVVDVVAGSGIHGIIATNTTLDRTIVSELNRPKIEAWGDGGLSGRGLKIKARQVQQRIMQHLPSEKTLIACGGIETGREVQQALEGGAALVQIYSALIFHGPGLVGEINRYLAEH